MPERGVFTEGYLSNRPVGDVLARGLLNFFGTLTRVTVSSFIVSEGHRMTAKIINGLHPHPNPPPSREGGEGVTHHTSPYLRICVLSSEFSWQNPVSAHGVRRLSSAEDRDAANQASGKAAVVVGKSGFDIPFQLAFFRFSLALKLFINLISHADAGGADGMTETF